MVSQAVATLDEAFNTWAFIRQTAAYTKEGVYFALGFIPWCKMYDSVDLYGEPNMLLVLSVEVSEELQLGSVTLQ